MVTAGLAVVLVLTVAGWLYDRRRDDSYTPLHRRRPVDGLQRALTARRRELSRRPAPWTPPTQRHSDVNP